MSEAVAEQDVTAAGSRVLQLPEGGTATASIELKFIGGRRIYAYLRYMTNGKTISRYVGEAPGSSREERLRAAWALAREKGLLG
jgi:hypothetical protein